MAVRTDQAVVTTHSRGPRGLVVRWAVAIAAVALVVTTITLFIVAVTSDPVVTGTDGSFEQAEFTRMAGLAPVGDGSWERAEQARMTRLTPHTDGSWERAEQSRMRQLSNG
jgi:hypothetical protein